MDGLVAGGVVGLVAAVVVGLEGDAGEGEDSSVLPQE